MSKAAKKAFSGAFHINYETANYAFNTASLHIVGLSLMKLTRTGALIENFGRRIERWINSSDSMDIIARWVSPPISLPAMWQKFISLNLMKQSEATDTGKDPRDNQFPFPQNSVTFVPVFR